jgi:hypothetical protein
MLLASLLAGASYLGCMKAGSLRPALERDGLANCARTFGRACGVVGIGGNGTACACFGRLPPAAAVDPRVPASWCGRGGGSTGVALYHAGVGAGGRRCRLQDVPLTAATVAAAYNPDRVAYMPANRTMRLTMDGTGKGTRVYVAPAFQYGTFQVDAVVDGRVGAVSAFYLRSDTRQETVDFSEIDYEFINGPPGTADGVWLNSWGDGRSGGVTLLRPQDYGRMMGAPWWRVSRGYTTFTLTWTPKGIAWHMNGVLMQARSAAAGRLFPYKPSYVTFSIWTSTPPHGTGSFGGVLPPLRGSGGGNVLYRSWFANHRRVVCS